MKILRPAKRKVKSYVIDEITFKNGKMIWKDKRVTRDEWELSL